jgi:sulfide:quinone oxidoreductase
MTAHTHRVLVVGGGVAGLETALALRSLAPGLVDVEILAPEHHFWYRPLAVAEPFGLGTAGSFELADLAAEAGALFTPGALEHVNTARKVAVETHGVELEYDSLVIAAGARPEPALRGALTFRGPADSDTFRSLLRAAESGLVERIAFALPAGAVWPLPLYELALMTARQLREVPGADTSLAFVTHEQRPLALFGPAASEVVEQLLGELGVYVFTGRYPVAVTPEGLTVVPGETIAADRVVSLPRLAGPAFQGLPSDSAGFIPADEHGRVLGLEDVYACGDASAFPVKQGGIAAQQADAVAQAIAAAAGAEVEPRPFRPVLRGLLLTGQTPQYLRTELSGGRGSALADPDPLWWPPAKIVGRYLTPFLAERGIREPEPPESGVAVEIELDTDRKESSCNALPSSPS